MLDKFRETSITWDKATRRIYSPITANASDSNGRKLNIQVVNSGQVENLTGATLHLYWETKDKMQHGLDAFTASDISKGEFEIFYTTGMLSNVGELNATLVLVDSTGKVVSDWFKITVARGIDGDAIQSENSFSSLTQALIDIGNLEQNYAPRLNDLTAQLQQTEIDLEQRAINVKTLGVVGDGVTDETSLIQNIFNSLNDGDTVFFPKGSYLVKNTILIRRCIKLNMDGHFLVDHAGIGVLAKNDEPKGNFMVSGSNLSVLDLELNIQRLNGKNYDKLETAIGFTAYNVFSGNFYFKSIKGNYKGVQLIADDYGSGYAGFTYCQIKVGSFYNYFCNIHGIAKNNGYFTQNQFYNGAISGGEASGSIGIWLENKGTSVLNENVFYSPAIEGNTKIGVKISADAGSSYCQNNRIISARFEIPHATHVFYYNGARFNSIIYSDYAGVFMGLNKFVDNLTPLDTYDGCNEVLYTDYRFGKVHYFSGVFYITPRGNTAENINNVNAVIPPSWDYRIMTSGMSNKRFIAGTTNTVNGYAEIDMRAEVGDILVVTGLVDTVGFRFKNPPTHSKEFYVRQLNPGGLAKPFSVGTDIAGLVDKTGGDVSYTPPGGNETYTKFMYDKRSNKLYIMEYY